MGGSGSVIASRRNANPNQTSVMAPNGPRFLESVVGGDCLPVASSGELSLHTHGDSWPSLLHLGGSANVVVALDAGPPLRAGCSFRGCSCHCLAGTSA